MFYVSQHSKNHANYNAPSLPSIRFTVGYCGALLSVTTVAFMAAPRRDDIEQRERPRHRLSVHDVLKESDNQQKNIELKAADEQDLDRKYVESLEAAKSKTRLQL